MKLVIDHIVVAAPDLDSGARHVARLLGVEPARRRASPHGHAQPRAGHGGRHVPGSHRHRSRRRRAGTAALVRPGRAGHARTAARRPVPGALGGARRAAGRPECVAGASPRAHRARHSHDPRRTALAPHRAGRRQPAGLARGGPERRRRPAADADPMGRAGPSRHQPAGQRPDAAAPERQPSARGAAAPGTGLAGRGRPDRHRTGRRPAAPERERRHRQRRRTLA